MRFILSLLLSVGVVVGLIASLKSEDKRPIQKLVKIGAIIAIFSIWGQYAYQRHDAAQEAKRHKELLEPVLSLAKSLNPELDDKAALIALIDELKKSFELGGRVVYEWSMGQPMVGVTQYDPDPNLVSALSSLLDHTDPSVREAAKTCLKSIGSDKAIKILQEKSKK